MLLFIEVMDMTGTLKFRAKVWVYKGGAAWHFVNLPVALSAQIKRETAGLEAGFGSLRVEVTIGQSTWGTSIFPSSKDRCYLLPLKSTIRKAEGIEEGQTLGVAIRLVDAVLGSGISRRPRRHPRT